MATTRLLQLAVPTAGSSIVVETGERQGFDDHIDPLDPVRSSRLDSVNVGKRERA
jgi:hypothetical protein